MASVSFRNMYTYVYVCAYVCRSTSISSYTYILTTAIVELNREVDSISIRPFLICENSSFKWFNSTSIIIPNLSSISSIFKSSLFFFHKKRTDSLNTESGICLPLLPNNWSSSHQEPVFPEMMEGILGSRRPVDGCPALPASELVAPSTPPADQGRP